MVIGRPRSCHSNRQKVTAGAQEIKMKHQWIAPIATVLTLGLACGGAEAKASLPKSASSPAFTGHRLAHSAKVTLAQARTIGLKARPGEITDQELETEHGGSGLRYSFDIKNAGVTYEVGVDAKTGEVLENKLEGKNPD
jgi:uncharacterized membrane protein YkoI